MSDTPHSILFRNGFVHSPTDPFATALFIEDGVIAWIGDDDTSTSFASRAEKVIDVDGALIAPGFVDAHVHLLETEMAYRAVDVSPSAGGTSREAVLELLAARLAQGGLGSARALSATGYDDSGWSGPGVTVHDLDTAFGDVPLYVPRADLHSAVCSTALLRATGLDESALSDGRLINRSHTAVRDHIRDVSAEERDDIYRSVLARAASLGFVAVHENSAIGIDTREGLARLIELTADAASGLPLVVGYRGELVSTADELAEIQRQIPGLRGLAGDLSVDGSIGSRSAAMREPYADDPSTSGSLHLSEEQIYTHLLVCSSEGITAGFHVIGDRALDTVLAAARRLAAEPGMLSAMRRGGHRLEHVELVDSESIAALVELGFAVSVQPAFDAYWGGEGDLYEQRLGASRRACTTPIRDFSRAGVPMAFGSDTPVTAFDPWGAVAAALFHNNRDFRISARAAFKAHTRGGWRVGGEPNFMAGELRVGAPAHLALWRADELGVQAENDGRSSWTTDARSGSPLLPILEQEAISRGERPQCVATLREGVFLYNTL